MTGNGPSTASGAQSSRKRHRFARQPFERAMRAEVNQRVDAGDLAQPNVECDIAVSRRQVGIVILRLAIVAPAAVRLHGKNKIARAKNAQPKGAIVARCDHRQHRPRRM